MNDLHEIRRGALLALCQFDAGRDDDPDSVRGGLLAGDVSERLIDDATALGHDAWNGRAESDAVIATLSTDWPIHRQLSVAQRTTGPSLSLFHGVAREYAQRNRYTDGKTEVGQGGADSFVDPPVVGGLSLDDTAERDIRIRGWVKPLVHGHNGGGQFPGARASDDGEIARASKCVGGT